jgi:uncharacterized protein YgbK (DUF1537 family)
VRTLEQIEHHRVSHPSLAIDAEALMTGVVRPEHAVEFIMSQPRDPLVYSSAAPNTVAAAQEKFGREAAAHAIESFFADVARLLVARGVRRLVVAGGETSGSVVSALNLKSLEIGPEIDPGVPALFSREGEGLGMALKSGNFGSLEFFDKALAIMRRGPD